MINTQLIDSHCHLDFPEFNEDRETILAQCPVQHINSIIVPGVCQKHWQRLLSLCEQHQMLYPALGLHPCFMSEHQADDLLKLEKACRQHSLLAIGEIGLDFFILKKHPQADELKKQQLILFREQLKLARQFQLPVLIHARKSHAEVLRQLKAIQPLSGIIHAFSGSYEQALEYLELGFKLGFGGAYTYPNASRLRTLVSKLPLDAWVLETDAPDMSPIQHHGQRNSPLYLPEIAQVFIELYDDAEAQTALISQIYHNTCHIFPALLSKSEID